MPRQARKLSETGYMHLIVRGNGKQILFEEEQDYRYFLKKLECYCQETSVKMCAYCLMENHVHLLVLDREKQTPLLMKKIGVSYSLYYNKKYDRKGHLFQDRYLSEAVDNEAYLLVVFRYILNNPKKAGICSAMRYPWNSYAEYDRPASYFDLSLLKELLGDRDRYEAFINEGEDDRCMEYEGSVRDDEWAVEMIHKCLGIESGTLLQTYSRDERNEALRTLKSKGMTIRQIERLTGINRNVIQKA